jgi:hypothetical protein
MPSAISSDDLVRDIRNHQIFQLGVPIPPPAGKSADKFLQAVKELRNFDTSLPIWQDRIQLTSAFFIMQRYAGRVDDRYIQATLGFTT